MSENTMNGVKDRSLDEAIYETEEQYWHWVFGYHLKRHLIHQIARERGMPWTTQPYVTILQVREHIRSISGVEFGMNTIIRKRGCSLILYFAQTGDRDTFSDLGVEYEGMDEVREAMGLPEGTKPKWYECSGAKFDEDAEDISEDEAWPVRCGESLL